MIEHYNNMDNKNENKKRHSKNIAIILTIIGLGIVTTDTIYDFRKSTVISERIRIRSQ